MLKILKEWWDALLSVFMMIAGGIAAFVMGAGVLLFTVTCALLPYACVAGAVTFVVVSVLRAMGVM